MLRAFGLAIPHRIQLFPQFKNQYGNENEWVKQSFFKAVDMKQRLWREAAELFSEALKGKKKAREELKELGNKDVAIFGAHQAWFGKMSSDIFTEIVWEDISKTYSEASQHD